MKFNKVIGFSIISILAMSFISVFNTSKVYATDRKISEDEVMYVNSTFVDINGEGYNAMIRNMGPDEYYDSDINTRGSIDNRGLMFGSTDGLTIGGIANGFTSTLNPIPDGTDGVMQYLAEDTLENGNLKIRGEWNNGTTLFPTNEGDASKWEYDEILKNWKFPFLKGENGYYSFNSNYYHVSRNYGTKTFELHEGDKTGFYPFNSCNDDMSVYENKNMYFTVRMDIPFTMTEDGKILNEKTGQKEDLVFNFSGDDDVWIFIDNKKVVDLGGNHPMQTGNLNLAKNEVYYSAIYDRATGSDRLNQTVNIANIFGGGLLSEGEHILHLFYMERAGGVSNLMATFNLQKAEIKVNHIDRASGKVLDTEITSGNVGDTITTSAKEFSGYSVVEKPDNETIAYKYGKQEVNYYYDKVYNLSVNYIDVISNEKIAPTKNLEIARGGSYDEKPIDIVDYELVGDSGNTSGTDINSNVEVEFYYKYNKGKAIANYIDKVKNENLDQKSKSGCEGDKVTFEELQFDNFRLVEKPESNDVLLTKKEQVLNYYYIHSNKITVKYIDEASGEELDKIEEVLDEGTKYNTSAKEFEDYELTRKPDNEEYTMGREDIEVTYYYKKLYFNLKAEKMVMWATVNDHYYDIWRKNGKVEAEIREANENSTVKIVYKIKVTNDQNRTGSGRIIETLPEGYSANQEDNYGWDINGKNSIYNVVDLKPGETREYDFVIVKTSNSDICGTVSNKVKLVSDKYQETTLDDNEAQSDLVIIPRTGGRKVIASIIVTILIVISGLGIKVYAKYKK